MSAGAFFLLTATCLIVTNSLENISNNGWRPMSNEKVAELQNFIKYPRNIPRSVYTIRPDMLYEYQRRAMQIGLKETDQYIRGDDDFLPFSINYLDNQRETLFKDYGNQAASNDKKVERKSKKVDEHTLSKINSANIIEDKDKQETTKSSNYEVTEDTKEEKEIEEKENKFGYAYTKPKAEIKRREEKNNLTKNLFSILADYNIRSSDQLPNYAISLRQNSRNSDHNYMYMHVPIRIPLSSNSLNHIPVDSLLAVFLSNYGHYLPGLYGFQRNYNNFYGYLASNNIHNNKPFGSYKIFSDTDTYH